TKVWALIDSERTGPGDPLPLNRREFVHTCADSAVPIDCHVLERRATENYFFDRAVKKTFGNAYRALGTYEKLADVSPAWPKSENWRIARQVDPDDLLATDLGQFLQDLSEDGTSESPT